MTGAERQRRWRAHLRGEKKLKRGLKMVRYFEDESTHATRALQIFLILVGLAAERRTITYRELSVIMSYGVGPILAHPLGVLMNWCDREGLPALTSIVVEKETGLPSSGLSTVSKGTVPAEQQRVFAYPWRTIFPPTVEELENMIRGDHNAA
jgi:hypothetical protein